MSRPELNPRQESHWCCQGLFPSQGPSMSISYSLNPSCGKSASHCQPRATSRRLNNREAFECEAFEWEAVQREGAATALDRGPQWRGCVAAGSGALRQSGPDQPCPEATGERGQAGADRPGGLRQGGARTDLRHSDGPPAPGGSGRRNLRSAGDPLATGGGTTALQRATHHPGALAHHLRYGQTTDQPPAPDRQAHRRV